MICQRTPTFRLLDPIVGWDQSRLKDKSGSTDNSVSTNIDGFDDRRGLRIASPHGGLVSEGELNRWITPPWITYDPFSKAMYVCGAKRTRDSLPILIGRSPCDSHWRDLLPELDPDHKVCQPIAVTASNQKLAIVDCFAGNRFRLWVWSLPSKRLVGRQELSGKATSVAFAPWREIIVSTEEALLRFDLSGQHRGEIINQLFKEVPIHRMVGSRRKVLWVASKKESGYFQLLEVDPTYTKAADACFEHLDFRVCELGSKARDWRRFTRSICKAPISSVAEDQFCITEATESLVNRTECYSRSGERLVLEPVAQCSKPDVLQGDYVTGPIDSMIPHCRWHRVQIDIQLPPQSSFVVEIATAEDRDARNLRWQKIESNPSDFLVDQPPGRFLFLKVRLLGNPESPVIKQIRLDFPRVTSLDQLPSVYREDPEAEAFTERFLSLFDSTMEELDRAIERSSEYLDVDLAPPESLRWLATLLGIQADSTWTPDQVRDILRRAPELYRIRGTKEGLVQALKLVFGEQLQPVVHERSKNRSWGVLAKRASLGSFRLFGKSESRFRVGQSALGRTSLRTFGNPDTDPVTQDAYLFEVLLPPLGSTNSFALSQIDKLIEYQKPAHTQHTIRVGGTGFVLGVHSVIGIDTQFVAPPTMILGEKGFAMRLGEGILGVGPNTPTANMRLDTTAFIGQNTTLE